MPAAKTLALMGVDGLVRDVQVPSDIEDAVASRAVVDKVRPAGSLLLIQVVKS